MSTLEPRRLKRVIKGKRMTGFMEIKIDPVDFDHPSPSDAHVLIKAGVVNKTIMKAKPKAKPTNVHGLVVLQYLLWCPSNHYERSARITLEAMVQPDGSYLWGIYQGRNCYNKSAKQFEWEVTPSIRPDRWYNTHRFATVDEALKAWDAFKRTKTYQAMIDRYEGLNNEQE